MKREFLTTGDGSVTIHLPEWDEQYHSKHGAIAEATHVFIKTGLHYWIRQSPEASVSILEIGFGTGLNTFLSMLEAQQKNLEINYTAVEAFPLGINEVEHLNYPMLLKESKEVFLKLHEVAWEIPSVIIPKFKLTKQKKLFSEIETISNFDLIYFDAFGARVQPELWTEAIFRNMFLTLKSGGVLVTYSAKGSVRRAMQTVGFIVERLPGPPGKREMLRALKPLGI